MGSDHSASRACCQVLVVGEGWVVGVSLCDDKPKLKNNRHGLSARLVQGNYRLNAMNMHETTRFAPAQQRAAACLRNSACAPAEVLGCNGFRP
ncbi:MAG TPA: hypothetical protein DIW77_14160 [Chromatiaceae bacterium]|nr:MAG: hypothetical protein N838_26325 [Thiohalocapsa sp. PB-PSB1]HCS91139.1 hypothetical protein [Chromatiaceae bacterium]